MMLWMDCAAVLHGARGVTCVCVCVQLYTMSITYETEHMVYFTIYLYYNMIM